MCWKWMLNKNSNRIQKVYCKTCTSLWQPWLTYILARVRRSRHCFFTAVVPQLQLWHIHWLVLYGAWATCIHQHRCVTLPVWRRRCYLRETHRLEDDGQNNVARIRVRQYQVDCYRHRGLIACRSIHGAYAMGPRLTMSPALHRVRACARAWQRSLSSWQWWEFRFPVGR